MMPEIRKRYSKKSRKMKKTLDFFFLLVYNTSVAAHAVTEIRRCIEVVITVSTRNRVTSKIVRGFESHRLRQKSTAQAVLFFNEILL